MEAPAGIRTSQIVALSLVVGGFFTAQTVFMALAGGRPLSLEWDVLQELAYWAVWSLLTPLIVAAARRWPLDVKPLHRPVVAHTAIAAALAPAQAVVAFGLHLVLLLLAGTVAPDQAWTWMARRSPSLVWGVFMGVFFYWLVVGVYTALHFRRLYAAERLSAAELLGRSATLEAELARAQLDSLRSQLRPHFLFNTLNAISTLTIEDPDKARRMVLRLGSLLRRSLDEEQHEVTLSQELVFLNDYLDIQRVRFDDRLSVSFAIDPAVTEARVPVLLLQPLVENAIEHGVPEKDGPTMIALSAARVDGMLRITVEDNGPGPGKGRAPREGIGLTNTRERLRRLYGEQATLLLCGLEREPVEAGARVDITIPFSPVSA